MTDFSALFKFPTRQCEQTTIRLPQTKIINLDKHFIDNTAKISNYEN